MRGERTAISEHEMKIVEVVVIYRGLEWDDEKIALKIQERFAVSREKYVVV